MKVVVVTEQRFYGYKGQVYVEGVADYNFWRRYLAEFSDVSVVGRLMPSEFIDSRWGQATGDGVTVCAVPHYIGPWQFAKGYWSVRRATMDSIEQKDAVILRMPGTLGSLVHGPLAWCKHPFGVEIVGDPDAVFRAGVVSHWLSPIFRGWFSREQQKAVSEACAVSYVTKTSLQQRYKTRNGVPSFSYSSISLTSRDFKDQARRYSGDQLYDRLIFVGALDQPYKGLDTLIDAMSLCRSSIPTLSLKVIGDGRLRPELEAYCAKRGLAERVQFMGMLPPGVPIMKELDQADLFVLPSKTEGLPRALIEAMARAMPCVSTRVGGVPELLKDEDLVCPSSAAALAGKILALLNNPERMAAASQRNLHTSRRYSDNLIEEERRAFYRILKQATKEWLMQ